jgi:hypothetical protein
MVPRSEEEEGEEMPLEPPMVWYTKHDTSSSPYLTSCRTGSISPRNVGLRGIE